jgi:hypothetical protein
VARASRIYVEGKHDAELVEKIWGDDLRAIGWPPEVPAAWQRILCSVSSYADLEPELLGRVEELIDFVTTPGSA